MKIHVDPSLCRGCEACELVCSLIHEGESNPQLARVQVRKDLATYTFTIILCDQCQQSGQTPACSSACASQAIGLDERGVVVIRQAECIQCGACIEACPYQAIFLNEKTGLYFKCEMCRGYNRPMCVEICPVGALVIEPAVKARDIFEKAGGL
jgi:anaerobic carbon-monoxide dehydrogenase iron sulfur subunit